MLATFVNSSDGFQDCWNPFFTLFRKFGESLRDTPVYLNTERASYQDSDLDIRSTAVWPQHESVRPSWSECLRRGIEKVREPYLLYLQEDYFLQTQVDSSLLDTALHSLQQDPYAGVVYLNRFGPLYTESTGYNDLLVQIAPPSRYLASTQAAIWRKDLLLSLLRDWENGWMFEIFGSRRAARAPYKFLSIRPDVMQHSPLIDYVYTGVIKGRWKQECVPLFHLHHIDINFAQRGMYQESGRLKSRFEVARKLAASPRGLIRSLESLSTL